MKTTFAISRFGVLVLLALEAKAGPLEFMREQLGVPATCLQFDSAPSAIPGIRSEATIGVGRSVPGEEVWRSDADPSISLTFTSNKLDMVTVFRRGSARNNKLVAAFAVQSGIATNKEPWLRHNVELGGVWQKQGYSLSCSFASWPDRREQVAFTLTTTASQQRLRKAQEARRAGPPHLDLFVGMSNGSDDKITEAEILATNEGGPASDLSVRPPAGVVVQVEPGSHPVLDQFKLTCKPSGSSFLPETWTFSMTYLDRGGKRYERYFKVHGMNVTETQE